MGEVPIEFCFTYLWRTLGTENLASKAPYRGIKQ